MTFIPAAEARLMADAVQEVRKSDACRKRVSENIAHAAGTGKYRLQIADMPQWLWEELKVAGYDVRVLPDGYEINWSSLDEDLNYIRG
jgi:hypothetical protein